ncbi:MAG: M16 family metallopeptidase [Candidatus Izemoplasmatales bacterium]
MNHTLITSKGMKVTFIPLNKFKTVQISLKMIAPFKAETINKRSLLPGVLLAGSKDYPNKKRLSVALEELYGMEINGSTRRIGSQSIISFDMSICADEYIPEETSLFDEGIKLLSSVLLHPLTRNNKFLKSIVEEEKRLIVDDLIAIYHDKQEYSFELFKNQMFPEELYRFNPKGDLSTLDSVTSVQLSEYYHQVLNEDHIELYIIGQIDPASVMVTLEKYLPLSSHQVSGSFVDDELVEPQNKYVVEKGDITQTKLSIGFRTTVHSKHPLHYAMSLFNIIFGESDQSILFQTIREKHHLSYYVSSMYVSSKSVLFVFAGIKQHEESEVVELVKTALEDVKQGNILEEQLDLAKKIYLSRMKKSLDSESQLIARHFVSYQLFGVSDRNDEIKNQIENMKLEDIIMAAKTVTLDTIHIYEGGDVLDE